MVKGEKIGEANFKYITKVGEVHDVHVEVAKPVEVVEGDGRRVFHVWFTVDPGLPDPRMPATGYTSLEALIAAIAGVREVLVSMLGAREVLLPHFVNEVEGDDGHSSIKQFFRL